ncbi:Sulfatase-modifying factor enzyme 1 [Flexibacter flexilis DSM 6793]|uniref:Sulfatase-modifying factor enzyme 1 n=1 Tax=Flexibacter flexilis DSM 6793 TaxID=927664 RepID=A0A1I1GQD0_9BACT|nr:SUMF1/EgtB/PvdO family nonheme iron enzyme [Flexibacter flexilis]SFC13844.1 Sulfatase-modifying factor enzyme 1 [Flexibacter flexilis DSM 6793]
MKQKFFALIFLLGLFTTTKANNLVIGTPAVSGSNLQFTIAWDNSWNTNIGPQNWDAVWVFVKRQSCTDNLWVHAPVSTSSASHAVTGTELQVDAVTDGMGVFVRRSSVANGNISTATVTLALQTAANVSDNFQVFGIEMVNIPQGDFYIGDNTSTSYNFRTLQITSAVQSAGLGAASVYQSSSYGSTANLPAAFPLGWNNFYCMKYEISQEQYASFLNTLTFVQQNARQAVSPASAVGTTALYGSSRNRIEISTSGVSANNTPAVFSCDLNNNNVFNETNDGQNVACNYLSWADMIAYLDWAALRPMTEFEFEKVGRGPASVVTPNEYCWGTTTATQVTGITNSGTSSEVASNSGTGLSCYGSVTGGPLRCGYAATSATTRVQAGASFYGVMELCGNVEEQCIGGYNYNYSAFTNANGDGTLANTGAANTANWPTSGGGTGGGIARGGDWSNAANQMQVSIRIWMTDNSNANRDSRVGGRGVRSF